MMDEIIDKALWNHAKITLRLRSAILAPVGVDEETVRSDRKCEFGMWLFGPGLRYCGSSEYQELKVLHKDLHEAAFEAFCQCRDGRPEIAKASIDGGNFKQHSAAMKDALFRMRSFIADREAQPSNVQTRLDGAA